MRHPPYRLHAVSLRQVVEVVTSEGGGTKDSPFRSVTHYLDPETGAVLAINDPCCELRLLVDDSRVDAAIARAALGGEGSCRVCGGRGWHTAGGNDPMACGACPAGEAWYSARAALGGEASDG